MDKQSLSLGAAELLRISARKLERTECQFGCKFYKVERGALYCPVIKPVYERGQIICQNRECDGGAGDAV